MRVIHLLKTLFTIPTCLALRSVPNGRGPTLAPAAYKLTENTVHHPRSVLARSQDRIRHLNETNHSFDTEISQLELEGVAYFSGSGYDSVTATITVPTTTTDPSVYLSGYLFIDGFDTNPTGQLLAGIDITASSGEVTIDAWYEWYPDYAYDFPGIDISVGDTVTITLTATSKTAGTASIENLTTGQASSVQVGGVAGSSLQELNAGWFAEAFTNNNAQISSPLSLTFSDAYVYLGTTKRGPSGAVIVESSDVAVTLTSTSVTVEFE